MSTTAESNASDNISSNANNNGIPSPHTNINGSTEAQDNTDTTNIDPEPSNPELENANPPKSNTSEILPPNNLQPPTVSPDIAPATPQPQNSELDKPLPLTYWLLTGGTGAPPSTGSFLRMTSERNAVTREAEARVIARQKALEERRAYLARWDEEWGPVGVKGLLARVFRGKKRKTQTG
ncbi:hypothetical protein GL218_03866 [Daldinia childiae]|uniref:uncharacterized protein n=1 Tax=Daldinia childiae TaxID=326645 RepID=UPI00144803CC|nr:uncharacterized protein GL218_03866 [Daldinia childiae]KAF3061033.1 hypothetical protein GL218_03866 [Daldinia childiae]